MAWGHTHSGSSWPEKKDFGDGHPAPDWLVLAASLLPFQIRQDNCMQIPTYPHSVSMIWV